MWCKIELWIYHVLCVLGWSWVERNFFIQQHFNIFFRTSEMHVIYISIEKREPEFRWFALHSSLSFLSSDILISLISLIHDIFCSFAGTSKFHPQVSDAVAKTSTELVLVSSRLDTNFFPKNLHSVTKGTPLISHETTRKMTKNWKLP